jgi:protein subunit release factor B
MNLNELFSVSPAKMTALLSKMERLHIDRRLIEEQFVRGGGKGGQKINKTSNAVVMKYPPLNLTVKVQRERQRNINRFLALRELVDQIEMIISPQTSPRLQQQEKIRKQKDRRRRRSTGSETTD